MTEDNLLYLNSTDLNVSLVLKMPLYSRLVFDQMPGHCDPAKLMYEVHHHRD